MISTESTGHLLWVANASGSAKLNSTGSAAQTPAGTSAGGAKLAAAHALKTSLLQNLPTAETYHNAGHDKMIVALGHNPRKVNLQRGECPKLGTGDREAVYGCKLGCVCPAKFVCIAESDEQCPPKQMSETLEGRDMSHQRCLDAVLGRCIVTEAAELAWIVVVAVLIGIPMCICAAYCCV